MADQNTPPAAAPATPPAPVEPPASPQLTPEEQQREQLRQELARIAEVERTNPFAAAKARLERPELYTANTPAPPAPPAPPPPSAEVVAERAAQRAEYERLRASNPFAAVRYGAEHPSVYGGGR